MVDLLATLTLTPAWNLSREANQYLGVLVVMLLTWRLVPMVARVATAKRRNADDQAAARHRLTWFIYIGLSIANATAAAINAPAGQDATWTSGTRLLLNVVAIGLCVWWPHPRYEPPTEPRSRP